MRSSSVASADMRARALLRRQPAVVLTIVGVIGVILYDAAFVHSDNYAGYWASTVTNASIFLMFSCAVSSASAAIAAGRARRGGLWTMPTARRRSTVALRALWPAFVGGLLVQLVGLALLVPATLGAPGRFPFEVVAAWLCILLFHTAVGFVLGRFLPMVASVPIAIFASYAWLGFTWSVDYYPIRYLAGLVLVDCCSVNTQLDARALGSVIVFSSVAAIALLCTAVAPPLDLGRLRTSGTWLGTVAGIVVAAIVGVNIASDLGPQPLVTRPSAEQRCEGAGPTVCLFPEQVAFHNPRPLLQRASANLHAAGVDVPDRIDGSRGTSTPAVLHMVIAPHTSAATVIGSLAASLLPDELAPFCGDGSDYQDRIMDAVVASWWLSSVAGKGQIDEGSISPIASGADTDAVIHTFSQLTGHQQRAWYEAASPALTSCDAKPVSIPTS
jgi:hypothetical protein